MNTGPGMTGAGAASGRAALPARFLIGLLAVPLLIMAVNLGGGAAKLPVEARSFEIVQGMLDSGDWLIPRIEGRPYLSKPPLYHWLAAAASLAEEGVSWRSVRAPSALAGALLLGVTVAWGSMLGGRALGAAAGLATASMVLVPTLARRGAPDMVFSAMCVAALYLFERMWRRRERRLVPLFALAVALAFMAKAHAVVVVVGAPVALALTLRRAWGRALRRDVGGWLALAALAGSAWYLWLLYVMPQEMLYWLTMEGLQPLAVELVGHTGRHFRPLWYYLYRIWDIALPVSALIPFTIWHVWRAGRWRGPGGWPFVVWSFLLLLLLFSLIPAKQPHYILPLLPLLGLMTGEAVLSHLSPAGPGAGRHLLGSMVVLLAVLVGVFAAAVYYAALVRRFGSPLASTATLLGAGCLAAMAWCLIRRRAAAFFLSALAAVWCLSLVYFGSFEEWKSLDRQTSRTRAGAETPAPARPPATPGADGRS